VKRRILGVLGGATTAALLATALQGPAEAAPPTDSDTARQQGGANGKADDRPDHREAGRRQLTKRAAELVLTGKRQVEDRNGSQAVRVAPGQWAQYGTSSSDQLLSFLVEFGDGSTTKTGKGNKKTAGTTDGSTSGPLHNQIPAPDRTTDNSTYWKADFNKQHYMDMFFNGMSEQNGESFRSAYEEMSSGRYTVGGDVSDWVKVDHPESYYGAESQADMTNFIDDTAEAWYKSQVAAGKTRTQIVDYLKSFDQWDRYDHDGDGDFNEPDGYIDHFQAIHAGEGEEAGAPEWTIWSHRWAVNQSGTYADGTGPADAQYGGIEIGDTGLWIRDYTTEPENGGLGVFTHEFGHDLGLPDFYDTQGGDNGTAFWTLMSSGSWLGHGDGAIGTTPNHMGPWEKFQLGWLDYDVAHTGQTSSHDLGPSYHATKMAQAVIAILPKKSRSYDLGAAAEGSNYFYSGRGDDRTATLTSPAFTVPSGGGQVSTQVKYDIEKDWDYAYTELSTDGGSTWQPIATSASTTTNPNGSNEGFGITGSTSGAWVPMTATLPSGAAGKTAQLRFRMVNDAAVNETGFLVDAINVAGAVTTGAENGADGWTLDGFAIADKGVVQRQYSHYYIAENRTYGGYDSTLKTGPYNFGWAATAPNRVEHFPYQDGLLVWYWDTEFSNNNTSEHMGGGEALPVDARAASLKWSDGTIARNRVQAFDATFGLTPTDPISLHRETANGMTTLTAPSRPAVAVFDDTDPNRYYDAANPGASVVVGGTGTRIEVISATQNGSMQVVVR
jgi:immune inhibitor A